MISQCHIIAASKKKTTISAIILQTWYYSLVSLIQQRSSALFLLPGCLVACRDRHAAKLGSAALPIGVYYGRNIETIG
jgi:hypothetical protein